MGRCGDLSEFPKGRVGTSGFSSGRNEKKIKKQNFEAIRWAQKLKDEEDIATNVRDSRP
jgi:hypothetical protein